MVIVSDMWVSSKDIFSEPNQLVPVAISCPIDRYGSEISQMPLGGFLVRCVYLCLICAVVMANGNRRSSSISPAKL